MKPRWAAWLTNTTTVEKLCVTTRSESSLGFYRTRQTECENCRERPETSCIRNMKSLQAIGRQVATICVALSCLAAQSGLSADQELVLRAAVTYSGVSEWSDEFQSFDEHVLVTANGTTRFMLETGTDGYFHIFDPIGRHEILVSGKGEWALGVLGTSKWSFARDAGDDYQMDVNLHHESGWAEFSTHSPPVAVTGVDVLGEPIDRGSFAFSQMHAAWAFWDSSKHGRMNFEPGSLNFTAAGQGRHDTSARFEHITAEGLMEATFSITVESAEPRLRIISVDTPTQEGDYSFIVTDPITLEARLTPAREGVPVKWTVEGLQAAAPIKGFPKDVESKTDAAGISTFSFRPSDNAALVKDRHTTWSKGSRAANAPIGFDVTAVIDTQSLKLDARLSKTSLGQLVQDKTDTLRQEYFDFKAGTIPGRTNIVSELAGRNLNRGNYTVQMSDKLQERFDEILEAYRSQIVTVSGQQIKMPASALIQTTTGGGFRNPRKNAEVSKHRASYHTLGQALDLKPVEAAVMVTIAGSKKRLVLDRHAVLYPALLKAAETQGRAIAEAEGHQVNVGCCRCIVIVKDPKTGKEVEKSVCEDHIHVQWK